MIRERQIFCHLNVIKEEKYDYRQKSWKSHFFILWWGKRGIQGKGRLTDMFGELSLLPQIEFCRWCYTVPGISSDRHENQNLWESCFYCGIAILSVHGYLSVGTETLLFTDLAVTAKMLE